MKLSVNLFMTLDGVSQGPGGPEEDTRGGFTRGGWMMPHFDAVAGEFVNGWYSVTGALLLGRRTYDIFASHWPRVTDPDDTIATAINTRPKYVVTSSPVSGPWADHTTALGGDFLDRIRDLKGQEGQEGEELQVHGSIQLARTLHEADLVDIYRFLIAPVFVGGGLRLFEGAGPAHSLEVVVGTVTPKGVVALELVPGEFHRATAVVDEGRDTVVGQ